MDTSTATAGPSSQPSSSSTSSSATTKVCKFYKFGTCSYGTACRNLHTNEPAATPQEDAVPSGTTFRIDPLKWINAPEFVPKSKLAPQPVEVPPGEDEDNGDGGTDEEEAGPAPATPAPFSYAAIVTMNNNHNGLGIIEHCPAGDGVDSSLCPYYEASGCCMNDGCPYEHGELCELCGKFCLNPADPEQRRQHNAECIKQHELDMEHSFAIQRSKDKICGICLEVILEKPGREQRFGILPNCNHIFCLECIRTWRKAKNFENKIKRGCPTCRVSSDFVCPSVVWVEGSDEKDKLINDYKKACNTTNCKHFQQGNGKCPFGNKCFYKHALPSGQLVDVGGPSRQQSQLRISHLQDFFREVIHQRHRMLDDFMSQFFSDSEDSELSEIYDYYDI
uniref:RING-type E3 ubiquitin transferase n=2 Tax=Culex tarsalis TaxID=7177 RepID=A0A1Q3EWL5_CULTA